MAGEETLGRTSLGDVAVGLARRGSLPVCNFSLGKNGCQLCLFKCSVLLKTKSCGPRTEGSDPVVLGAELVVVR